MTLTASFAPIPLKDLQFSATTAQAERRKRFDKAAIRELADSILSVGLQQPIVARRVNGHFEVVAGERRVMAAREAELDVIDAIVRDMTDEQVLEVQLIENLQREGLHELAEAEGYEALMKVHKHTADDVAAKVGKSKAYIYGRLKLTALCPEARKAFYAGKLNASTALYVARIPIHDLQRKALKEITHEGWRGPMSARDAAKHIQENYMLRLDQAPFPTANAELLPAAGPCGSCPKRTGNQPTLFGDVKSADVCTDPICFGKKREANAARLVAAAEASGKAVISGAEAKKIAPDGIGEYSRLNGYVRLDERFWSVNKQRTYRATIGKDVEVKHLQDPESGKLVEVVAVAEAKAALKKRGIKDDFDVGGSGNSGGNDRYKAEQRARDRKRRIENEFRRRLYNEIRGMHPTKLGRVELEIVAQAYWERLWNETGKDVAKLWGETPEKRKGGYGLDVKGPLEKRIPKMTDSELATFILDMAFAKDFSVPSYGHSPATLMLATAKRLKINADAIRRQVQTELAPKKKPSSKKKPTGKAR